MSLVRYDVADHVATIALDQPEKRNALSVPMRDRIAALIHEAVSETSRFEDYMEILVNWSTLLYPCENTRQEHKLAPVDV